MQGRGEAGDGLGASPWEPLPGCLQKSQAGVEVRKAVLEDDLGQADPDWAAGAEREEEVVLQDGWSPLELPNTRAS